MRVTHLDIDPRHTAALADAGLSTTVDLLLLSTPEIARRASLSLTAARAAKVAAAATEFPRGAITAQELLASREHHTARLTTGCPALDASLQGGILGRGITEVVGESAAAKTQFCLQLAVTVQLPLSAGGLAGAAVYICTEDAFPNKRMAQLSEASRARWPELGSARPSDRVYVEHSGTVAGLLSLLTHKSTLPFCAGLLVCDHYTYAKFVCGVRGDLRSDERVQVLKGLSDEWHTPVICVNQVSDLVGSGDAPRLVIPALGLAWSDMVNTRLFLQKARGDKRRTLSVVLASHLPPTQVGFEVTANGVHGQVDEAHTNP